MSANLKIRHLWKELPTETKKLHSTKTDLQIKGSTLSISPKGGAALVGSKGTGMPPGRKLQPKKPGSQGVVHNGL